MLSKIFKQQTKLTARYFSTFNPSLAEHTQAEILNQYNANPVDLDEYRKKIIYR